MLCLISLWKSWSVLVAFVNTSHYVDISHYFATVNKYHDCNFQVVPSFSYNSLNSLLHPESRQSNLFLTFSFMLFGSIVTFFDCTNAYNYYNIFRKHSSHDSPKTKQLQLVKASLFLEMRISYQNVCFCLCLHDFPPLSFHAIPLVASWWKTQHIHRSQQTNCIRDCRFSPT